MIDVRPSLAKTTMTSLDLSLETVCHNVDLGLPEVGQAERWLDKPYINNSHVTLSEVSTLENTHISLWLALSQALRPHRLIMDANESIFSRQFRRQMQGNTIHFTP